MKTTQKPLIVLANSALAAGGMGLVGLLGLGSPSASATPALADISLSIDINAPPPPRHEVIIESSRPGPDYVWVGGYWDGAPGHYAWVAGHWERPPHRGAAWVAPRWEKDRDGHYHKVEGGWR